jgi:preprotein translocase SecE subunit
MKQLTAYIGHVREEMQKVHWPTWAMLKNSTSVVVFLSMVLAFTVFLFDRILSWLMGLIL